MKMPSIAAQILTATFGFAAMACMQTPQYRMPAVGTPSGASYYLPDCTAFEAHIGTQRAPCRPLVVYEEISECEKRFGKICNAVGQGEK
jgi:hypothetical protein